MSTTQGPSPENLAILESGRTLKVQTDGPHLVSLGSGRLSTAITLHPLPDGSTSIGSHESADIPLCGPGIEPQHCVIERRNGTVTLYPTAGMTTVDGLPVGTPIRLSQGSVLCVGLTTHLRFNHPSEARLMKSRTPNGDRPPLAPNRRSSGPDSCGEECNEEGGVFNKVSKFEHLSQTQNSSRCTSISPKVFPMGSVTVNSPASAVLGHNLVPNGRSSSPQEVKRRSPVAQHGVYGYIEPPKVHTVASFPKQAYPTEIYQNGYGNPLFTTYNGTSSHDARVAESPRIGMPSPAFNRNPTPYVPDRCRSVTPNMFSARQSPPVTFPPRSITPSPQHNSYSPSHSRDDLIARREELEMKRMQAQMDRRHEEDIQLLEKQRLEEILTMCAEYERQAQSSQEQKLAAKPPSTPTLQQNRIKTNGSLPRDKRSGGLSPSAQSASDDELSQILHVPESPRALTSSSPLLSDPSLNNRSPYENLSRPDQLDVTVHRHVFVENTLVIESQPQPPLSPRTRIRTTLRDQSNDSFFSDYDTADSVRRRNPSPNVQHRKYLTPSQQLAKFTQVLDESPQDKFILPLGDASDLSDVIQTFDKELSSTKCLNGVQRLGESRVSQDVRNDLPESERDLHLPKVLCEKDVALLKDNFRCRDVLRKSTDKEDASIKAEKEKWIHLMGSIKAAVNNIELQEEEILREMEMERALIEAEYLKQREKRKLEDEKLSRLKERQKLLDAEIEQSQLHDSEAQTRSLERLRDIETQLNVISTRINGAKELSEEYQSLVEIFEQEKKTFEDLEFKHLEEEANWLASRDDLQREIDDLSDRLEARTLRLTELERQVKEIQRCSGSESSVLELQKLELLQRLEEARTRFKDLDAQLSCHSSRENSSDNDEMAGFVRLRPKSKQSQDDLERITRVTNDAPMNVGKTGSLNRKTLESLREIEKNRQLHLAMQGVQVIEEERKRVEQLKRRVQDEVRAQWEQNRQRESSGNNSLGSEGSSHTSSDQPIESVSSDDVDKALTNAVLPLMEPIADVNSEMTDSMIEARDNESIDHDSRPVSGFSDFEQSCVKKRNSNPERLLQQRPLTRYLPIRGDALNLRSHIESAGHQVDLCRHIVLDATSCRGLLQKYAGKFHHWNKRWFVFDRLKKSLTYYSDRSERKPRGGTYFLAIEEVYVDHLNSVKSPHPHLTFVIKTKERTYHLMAPSAEAMRIWVDVVFTGAEGYQEFEPRS